MYKMDDGLCGRDSCLLLVLVEIHDDGLMVSVCGLKEKENVSKGNKKVGLAYLSPV